MKQRKMVTGKMAREMMKLRADGFKVYEIAEIMGVSQATASRYSRGVTPKTEQAEMDYARAHLSSGTSTGTTHIDIPPKDHVSISKPTWWQRFKRYMLDPAGV